MMFTTLDFAVFLLPTLALYYAFPRMRLWMLTVANVIFYGYAGAGYLLLFGAVSTVVYLCALGMGGRYGRLLLWLGIAVPVGNLFLFKYTDFFLRSVERVLNLHLVSHDQTWLHLVLPLGISFYTFELISYLVDVRKRKIEPERHLLRFWMFIMFFPHMIAGPIMRGNEFLPQVRNLSAIRWQPELIRSGLLLILLGLFKKNVLSDAIAPYCDSFFTHPGWLSGAEGWTGAALYAFQIYLDFSGYSDLAVGLGLLFGLKLAANFRTPYVSANATEFWRRWHITLSTWIRDYIYIPLGGSRHGPIRQYGGLFAAMTLSGIWHGSNWTFAFWGMYQGGLLIAHKLYRNGLRAAGWTRLTEHWLYKGAAVAVFFALTCIGWVLFRTEHLKEALVLIRRMLMPSAFIFPGWVHHFWLIILGLAMLHLLEYLLFTHAGKISAWWQEQVPAPVRAGVYTLALTVLVLASQGEQSNFIYFQF
ncbi:MBOAT family O-acyltransferase [Gorillibacterium sp. sgz5001074]|uniref:MBOAT family O-acyltransferase n=1 Tax=Gorillibacterium sp. sgz5001074 TaxID=3446695 RepID=UPI003F6662A2